VSSNGNENVRQIPADPNLLKPEDFASYEEYLSVYHSAKAKWDREQRIEEIATKGDFALGLLTTMAEYKLASERALGATQESEARRQTLLELFDLLKEGGSLTVRPAPGQKLEVWRWAGSEYHEHHEVAEVLDDSREFQGFSLSLTPDDAPRTVLHNSPIVSDTHSTWVYLELGGFGGAQPKFIITEVGLPGREPYRIVKAPSPEGL
jgi:hypothetical protein